MGIFFVSWELWEQMTFVLACAIVLVFALGMVKLWSNNRIMKKQELLDEEKRARLQEMRRTGLSVKRGNDVPFGVRAIQSGIVVEGIWISRPPSPNLSPKLDAAKMASATTLVGLDSDSLRKGKSLVDDARSTVASTINYERSTGKQPMSDGSIFQRLNDSDSYDSSPLGTPPVSRFTSQPANQHQRIHSGDDGDSLGSMDGPVARPLYETYVPTSAPRNPRRSSQRSSASSSGESVSSGRSGTSSNSARFYAPRAVPNHHHETGSTRGRTAYTAVPQNMSPEMGDHQSQARDPFETPLRTPSGFSVLTMNTTMNNTATQSEQSTPLMSAQPVMPEPTFGPGDLYANRTSRRVNPGFEVLPAGTFGGPQSVSRSGSGSTVDLESQEEVNQANRFSRISNRLRKKSVGGHEPMP